MDNIGDVMTEGRDKALRSLAIFAGILVYLGMVVYSAVHNWHLMTSGIQPDMVIWAALGVVALEISAIFLPIALHWWTHSHLQRITAFAFYGLDLGLIFVNVVLDYAVNTGEVIPSWLSVYKFFVLPASPIFCGLGWSLLFLLDPAQRERAMIENLRASTQEVLANRIASQAKSADLADQVDQAAATMAADIVRVTLGASLSRSAPRDVVDVKARDNGRSYNLEDESDPVPTVDLGKVMKK
jgi:hypothetical protein